MDTNVQALKNLYEQLGGDPADVADISTNAGMINAIAELDIGGGGGGSTPLTSEMTVTVSLNLCSKYETSGGYTYGIYATRTSQWTARNVDLPDGIYLAVGAGKTSGAFIQIDNSDTYPFTIFDYSTSLYTTNEESDPLAETRDLKFNQYTKYYKIG